MSELDAPPSVIKWLVGQSVAVRDQTRRPSWLHCSKSVTFALQCGMGNDSLLLRGHDHLQFQCKNKAVRQFQHRWPEQRQSRQGRPHTRRYHLHQHSRLCWQHTCLFQQNQDQPNISQPVSRPQTHKFKKYDDYSTMPSKLATCRTG